MSRIICGIDPGKDGAICLLDEETLKIIYLARMPVVISGDKKKTKREFDIPAIVELIRRADYVAIEKAGAMPEQGVVSMFNFGAGYGLLIGITAGLGKPYSLIHPRTWKGRLLRDMPKGKMSSVLRAKQLCPEISLLATTRCSTPHEGMAEAYLIARYGKNQIEPF
ncbi:MAG: hypothetical protein PHF37_10045 [Phycisphaerae bacterium]|nr:hypothetical protein [Phycisphaerae bacterium]